MKTIVVTIAALLSIVYLINPTAGIIELIPDNIPFIGNVDEALASFILFSSIEYFRGKPIGIFRQRRIKMSHSKPTKS